MMPALCLYVRTSTDFLFNLFLAMPHGMRNLVPTVREVTHAPCSGSPVLTTRQPGSPTDIFEKEKN